MKRVIWWSAMAMTTALSAPAIARGSLQNSMMASYWTACDGYGRPTATGDGMTKEALGFLGLFTGGPSAGNTFRVTPTSFGKAGVDACTSALGDNQLRPTFWGRKVSLLRARALHQLAEGRATDALADLAAADAAAQAPNDKYYQRSLGLGIKMVRALALEQQGDHEQTLALASEVLKARPWSRSTAVALFAIVPDERAMLNGEPMILPVARLQPKLIDTIFADAIRTRDFPRAINIFDNVVPPTKVLDRGVYGIEHEVQETTNEALAALFATSRRAALAYAKAATGDGTGAKKALAEADSALRALAAPIAPLAPGQKEGRRASIRRTLNTTIVEAGKKAEKELAVWRWMTDTRLSIADGTFMAPEKLPQLLPNGATLDLLMMLEARGNKDAPLLIAALQKILEPKAMERRKQVELLFAALPHAEISERIAAYQKAPSGFMSAMFGGSSGFKTKPQNDGSTLIEFTGEKSSGSVVEELALLRAAEVARQQGKTGFVILSRADFERSLTSMVYGVAVATTPTGYTTELVIRPVDPTNLPEPFRRASWRVIDAGKVTRELGNAYSGAALPN